MAEQSHKQISLEIPLINKEHALLISEVLNVDSELKGSGVTKNIVVKEDYVLVTFDGVEFKKLRVAVNAFMRNVLLILKTHNIFG